ncbi:MAG: glycosyl transferase family 2 [Bacilli bacterium]
MKFFQSLFKQKDELSVDTPIRHTVPEKSDKTYTLTIEQLKAFTFPVNQQVKLNVVGYEVPFEFLVTHRPTLQSLVVIGSGAFNPERIKPPIFHRHSWFKEIEASTIFYNDPTFYLNSSLSVAWLQGTAQHFYLETVAEIVREIQARMNKANEDLLFYGSSAGGFTSMLLGTLFQGSRVLVNNPQTIVPNYSKGHVGRMMETSYQGLAHEEAIQTYQHRLEAVAWFVAHRYVPNMTYLQNAGCAHDLSNHLIPFMRTLAEVLPDGAEDVVKVVLYHEKEKGHNPLDKDVTLRYIHEKMKERDERNGS